MRRFLVGGVPTKRGGVKLVLVTNGQLRGSSKAEQRCKWSTSPQVSAESSPTPCISNVPKSVSLIKVKSHQLHFALRTFFERRTALGSSSIGTLIPFAKRWRQPVSFRNRP